MTDHPNTGPHEADRAADAEFLDRLAAADPVEPTTLPTATDPEARQLLTDILTAEPDPSIGWDESARPTEAPVLVGAGAGPATGARAAGRGRSGLLGRGRGTLLATAAAVAVVAGAVTVLAPDNTPAAVAEVHSAAATTAASDTGRIATTFRLDYADDVEQGSAGGTIEAVYADDDLALSIGFDELPDELQAEADEFLPVLDDIRLVDDVAYVQQGGQWIGVDTGGLLGDVVVRYVDPRVVLDTVQELTEATEDGSADLDGVATTRYRSVIDLGDETLAQSGWLAYEGVDIDADGEVTVEFYVDDDGLLRRLDIEGDLDAPEGETGEGTFEVSTTFSDLGAELTVEAPEGAELLDPLAEAFELDE